MYTKSVEIVLYVVLDGERALSGPWPGKATRSCYGSPIRGRVCPYLVGAARADAWHLTALSIAQAGRVSHVTDAPNPRGGKAP